MQEMLVILLCAKIIDFFAEKIKEIKKGIAYLRRTGQIQPQRLCSQVISKPPEQLQMGLNGSQKLEEEEKSRTHLLLEV